MWAKCRVGVNWERVKQEREREERREVLRHAGFWFFFLCFFPMSQTSKEPWLRPEDHIQCLNIFFILTQNAFLEFKILTSNYWSGTFIQWGPLWFFKVSIVKGRGGSGLRATVSRFVYELLPFVIKFKLCDRTRDFPLAKFSENIILMSSTPRNENNCSKLGWQQNQNKQAPIPPIPLEDSTKCAKTT